MNPASRLKTLHPISLAAGLLCLAAGAQAQSARQGEDPPQKLERVEITGSNIRRVAQEGSSPVLKITGQDLVKSGKATVAEYLQTLGVDGAGSLPTGFGNGFAAGSTAVSLRGLGATSTLVLLNGRRMAPYGRADDGQKTFTDLSTIPMELVDRIEILKDGASSVYGADAIAGVVNIILKKELKGLTWMLSTGQSAKRDAEQNKFSLSGGLGEPGDKSWSGVYNLEVSSNARLENRDRAGRDWIGKGDIRAWGYPMLTVNSSFYGGQIGGNNSASASPAGSVRDPVTKNYQSLPGCASLSATKAQDPNGGCLWYADQFRSMQPEIRQTNAFASLRAPLQDGGELFFEALYNHRETSFMMVPPSITPTVAFPPNSTVKSGVIDYGSDTGVVMAATHPQNPFKATARVRYIAFDVGPQDRRTDSSFHRVVAGGRTTWGDWDLSSALVVSGSTLNLTYTNMLNMAVVKAALGDPTSSYFPYYLGADAGKNPASLYKAMVTDASAVITTSTRTFDVRASRELMTLPGGPMGLALGAEWRVDKLNAPSLNGTETGAINASYVAAQGNSRVNALYAEVLAPITAQLEATAAVRHDNYSQFKATTPKLGVKFSPMKTLALRGSYSEGFRAPGPAESNPLSQSTGNATARDPVRCPGGTPVPNSGATQSDCGLTVGAVKVGNPDLKPERAKGVTLGLIWDVTPATSVSVDWWQIRRSDEINLMTYEEAAALPTAIRSDNNLVVGGVVQPGTGTLLISKAPWRNGARTTVGGVDLDVRQRFSLGEAGRLTLGLNVTRLNTWKRAEKDTVDASGKVTPGKVYEFVGTHGNCDTSNCAGTPAQKANITATWDVKDYSVTATYNHRASMSNEKWVGSGCAAKFADGTPAPAGCRLPSFGTLDLSARWQYSKALQLFASVQNLGDRVAPLDPLTYGAMSYNPLDASGAMGRYFKLGLKYKMD